MTMKLEDKIKFLFLKRVLGDMEEEREEGWHVTELVYDCLRRCYYERKYKEILKDVENDVSGNLNEDLMLTFWIGKKLHEMPLSKRHEYVVRWKDIVGRIDEILEIDGELIILDKKTVRRQVNAPYEHHVKQVEMYSGLLFAQDGIEVNKGGILYIDVANKNSKVFTFELERNKAKILAEMERKRNILAEAIEKGIPPELRVSWLCNYCNWFERCIRDYGGVG